MTEKRFCVELKSRAITEMNQLNDQKRYVQILPTFLREKSNASRIEACATTAY